MAKTLKINGIDFADYFTEVGYSVSYASVQGNNAGLMLDGSYTEDEIAQKAVITFNCMPLNETQISRLLTEIYGASYHTVTYFDPKSGTERTITARRSVSEQKYRGYGADTKEYWTGTVVTMTER